MCIIDLKLNIISPNEWLEEISPHTESEHWNISVLNSSLIFFVVHYAVFWLDKFEKPLEHMYHFYAIMTIPLTFIVPDDGFVEANLLKFPSQGFSNKEGSL